jgi:hypothetical protein
MVDGIPPSGPGRPTSVQTVSGTATVHVRRREQRPREAFDQVMRRTQHDSGRRAGNEDPGDHGGDHGNHRGGGRGADTHARGEPAAASPADPARLAAARRAYGGARGVGGEPGVVTSQAAAVLATGDLDGLLRRAAQAIRQMAETLLGAAEEQTAGLVEAFTAAALEWVRSAVADQRGFAEQHDGLPIGISFEDVRVMVDAGHGGLAIEVGGVHFRRSFSFRTEGVVFDIRGSGAVRTPGPGFFVDSGETETDAAIASAILDKVRADLPSFGISRDTEGVCVLIRSEGSDFDPNRDGGWVIDIDVHVPFDPGWGG